MKISINHFANARCTHFAPDNFGCKHFNFWGSPPEKSPFVNVTISLIFILLNVRIKIIFLYPGNIADEHVLSGRYEL